MMQLNECNQMITYAGVMYCLGGEEEKALFI